mmetsp:Transcript_38635/g.95572  ORF Transcript_38635/g.95572 Transcript_38635/m.95572 type:complete len:104 (-) Transcript_38635:15-326(-)
MKKLFPRANLSQAFSTDFSYEYKGEVIVDVQHDKRTVASKAGSLATYIENVKNGLNETELLASDPENCLKYSSTLVSSKLMEAEGRKVRETIQVKFFVRLLPS